MFNKRFLLYSFFFVFLLTLIAVFLVVFSVKKINVKFDVGDREEECVLINEEIQKLKGKNILFLKNDKINKILQQYPYFEITKTEKNLTSTVNVFIKQRHAVFSLFYNQQYLIISDEGIVLEITDNKRSNLIDLDFTGNIQKIISDINVLEYSIGKKIITNFDEYVYSSFNITNSIDSTDRISTMHVIVHKALQSFDIEYTTHTLITLYISEANISGKEKALNAISFYDNEEKDYKKSSENDMIYVSHNIDGELICVFRQRDKE